MLSMASQIYNYTPAELQKLLDESNSYKELLRKLNMCDHGSNYNTLRKIIDEYNLDLTIINKNRKNENLKDLKKLHFKQKIPLDEILIENSTYNHGNNLKKRLFEENLKEYICERCGLTEWQGQPIPLQLHHENGIHNDNRIENLKLLCPNCHALTDNFAGKNVKQIPKVSKEELIKTIEKNSYTSAAEILGVDKETASHWYIPYIEEEREKSTMIINSDKAPARDILKTKIRTMSFVQIGKEYNVTDNSVRKWCDAYNLPRHSSKIKQITDEEWKKI